MFSTSKTYEVTEESKDFTPDATQNRIKLAWKLILEQHFIRSKKVAQKEGPGVGIFRFLRQSKKDTFNCEYFYAEKDDIMWKTLMTMSSDGEKIARRYDPLTTLAICVQIPIGLSENNTIGSMKLISIETGKEVDLEEESEVIKIDALKESSSEQTLHKRNINTAT